MHSARCGLGRWIELVFYGDVDAVEMAQAQAGSGHAIVDLAALSAALPGHVVCVGAGEIALLAALLWLAPCDPYSHFQVQANRFV